MSASETVSYKTQGTQPNNFTMLPNMAFEDLSPNAFKLLAVYLDIAKTDKVYAKNSTVTKKLGVSSVNTMKKARTELTDKGYIAYSPGKDGDKTTTASVIIKVGWMWDENNKRMSENDTPKEEDKGGVSNIDTVVSNIDRGVSAIDTNKQELNNQELNNQDKDSASDDATPDEPPQDDTSSEPPEKSETPPLGPSNDEQPDKPDSSDNTDTPDKPKKKQEVLGDAFGVQPVTGQDWGLYGKVCKQLTEAGIEPSEYTDYIAWVRKLAKGTGGWKVTIPSLISGGRVSDYVSTKKQAQEKTTTSLPTTTDGERELYRILMQSQKDKSA